MERFTADALKAERDAHVKAALKANQPWMDVMSNYGLTLAEVMAVAEEVGLATKRGSSVVIKDEPKDDLIIPPTHRRRP